MLTNRNGRFLMRMRLNIATFLIAALSFWSASARVLAADQMTRYNAAPGSKMRVEGTSTAHDWQAESPIISGFLEVGPNFPTEPGQNVTPGKVTVKGQAEVMVSSLMSVEKNGQKYSDKMDDKMHDMLHQTNFPKIVFRLTDLTLKGTKGGGAYEFDSKGDLAVAGVTNAVSFAVTITVQLDKKLKISGSVP